MATSSENSHIKLAEYLIRKHWHSVAADKVLLQIDGNNQNEQINNLATIIKEFHLEEK